MVVLPPGSSLVAGLQFYLDGSANLCAIEGRTGNNYIISAPQAGPHFVRVRVANDSLNSSVANGAVLQFDTIDSDTDGYAVGALPLNQVIVPSGLGGLYIICSAASATGNQSVTIGIGITINGSLSLSDANQFINGPASVNYGLTKTPTQIGYLKDGDQVSLYNTSQTAGPNAFTHVFMSLAKIG